MRRVNNRRNAWFRPQWLVAFLTTGFISLGIGFSQKVTALNQQASNVSPSTPIVVQTFTPAEPVAPLDSTDCSAMPCVSLTFDDGPDPTYTPAVLDVLAREHVQATFFMIGYRAAMYPDIVKRTYLAGHDVENHSFNHADFTKLKPADMESQIAMTQSAIVAAGVPAPTMFRPPYGARNDTVKAHVHMPQVLWNVDTLDWKTTDPNKVAANASGPVLPGSIVLMHSVHAVDAAALPMVIEQIRAKGYHIVPISQLLNIPAGATGGEYSHR
jgi:peptidoglycan/xylan/chitin deacetylase (PgdA/CDA1 family)